MAFCRVKSGKREGGRRRFANCKMFFNGDYNVTMSRSGVKCWVPWCYVVTLRRAHYHQMSHTMGGCDGGKSCDDGKIVTMAKVGLGVMSRPKKLIISGVHADVTL